MRGLGFGILITALVFCFVNPSEMSDEEIIKRAEELGYSKPEETPGINLKDLMETGTPTPELSPEASPEPTQSAAALSPTVEPTPTVIPTTTVTPTAAPTLTVAPTPATQPTPTIVPTPTAALAPTIVPASTVIPTPTVATQPEEVITIDLLIERGVTAAVLSAKLEAAGIIEHANALTEYLILNEMTDDIIVGTYTLSSDMTLAEIANIVTRREIRE